MRKVPVCLADVEEIEKVPFTERLAADNVHDAIARSAMAHPDRPAIINLARGELENEPEVVTYGELLHRINATANLLHSLGVGPTDVTTLLMPITPAAEYCLWGAETVGIANPVNPFLEVEHIIGICKAAGTKVLIGSHPDISPDAWPKIEEVRKALPDLKIIQVGGTGADVDDGVIIYEDAIAGMNGDSLDFPHERSLDAVAAYFHTGGTTGVPKLARHTQKGLLLHSWTFGNAFPGGDMVHNFPLGIPLFHVGGGTCYSLMPFIWGHTVTLLGPEGYRNPNSLRDFFANAERLGWTLIPVVPAIWSMLLHIPHEGYDLSRITHGGVGGSTLSVEVNNGIRKKLGIPLAEGWGMTETHGFATLNPYDGEIRVGSVGIRQPYMNVRIVEPDGQGGIRRDCGVDEIGLVVCRGPQVFGGYLDPVHDSKSWLEGDNRTGWLDTGDLGRIDADGYIWLTGRAKDLIIRGGHNIDPALIEDLLYQHPAIALAAAVGRPDKRVGEMPVAFVQFKPGQSATEDELKAFVSERIAERAANPVEIVALDEVPLTGVGKIFKPALRHEAAKRVYEREFAGLARELGVAVAIEVRTDKRHGTLAIATISGAGDKVEAERRIHEAMGAYDIRFEIAVA